MKLAFQMGYGMKKLCLDLLPNMQGASVILSPRDLNDKQLVDSSKQCIQAGGKTLIDPQLYATHADRHQLLEHAYWPNSYSTGMLSSPDGCRAILTELNLLNQQAETSYFIIPGLLCKEVDEAWKGMQRMIINEAKALDNQQPKIVTLALSEKLLLSQQQVDGLIDYIETINCDAFYLIPEHENNEYFIESPIYLLNLLYLTATLKLMHKRIIVGYCNQQMLYLSLANVDEIASGTWLNVRLFTLNKFIESDDIKRKKTWYYCPQALSEYTLSYLDIAQRNDRLEYFKPTQGLPTSYSEILFSGAIPSTTEFKEPNTFRHYLACLAGQCKNLSQGNFQTKVQNLMAMLANARRFIEFAHAQEISGKQRDFELCLDETETAVKLFVKERGELLSKVW